MTTADEKRPSYVCELPTYVCELRFVEREKWDTSTGAIRTERVLQQYLPAKGSTHVHEWQDVPTVIL